MQTSAPKQRIMETATRLFYRQGYNNTGINQILDEAKVAKASLYQHFTSKEELGLEYLRESAEQWAVGLEQWMVKKKSAAQKVAVCFDYLEYVMQQQDFMGCRFINMMAEVGESSDMIYSEIFAHKTRVRSYFRKLVNEALLAKGKPADELMGDAIYLLFEGAIVETKICRNTWPARRAREMTLQLLER
ncbi:TetR/AcrR family transcriptional regulator [Chitinophaga lutea]